MCGTYNTDFYDRTIPMRAMLHTHTHTRARVITFSSLHRAHRSGVIYLLFGKYDSGPLGVSLVDVAHIACTCCGTDGCNNNINITRKSCPTAPQCATLSFFMYVGRERRIYDCNDIGVYLYTDMLNVCVCVSCRSYRHACFDTFTFIFVWIQNSPRYTVPSGNHTRRSDKRW